MKEFWDSRYSAAEYAYGTEPNAYFRKVLEEKRPTGKILLAAEGEGRNAVFAAQMGLEVTAFDLSEAGKEKAMRLAKEKGVEIDYRVGDFGDLEFARGSFDVIALIYAHFPADRKMEYLEQLSCLLKSGGPELGGGLLIFEAFGKSHLKYRAENPGVGGPPDLDTLFSVEELQKAFYGLRFEYLAEEVVELHEGLYHNGRGSVLRAVGWDD